MRSIRPLVAAAAAFSLSTGLLPAQTLLYAFRGNGIGAEYGASVALVGDIDGDGFGDIAIGAPGDRANGVNAGLVEIRSGRNGSILRTHRGASAGAGAGRVVCAMGDVDVDGRPDYAFASPGESGGWPGWLGTVQVISGRSGVQLHNVTDGMQGFSLRVARAGRLDADASADIIAGSGNESRIWAGGNRTLIEFSVGGEACGVFDTNGNGLDEWADTYRVFERGTPIRWISHPIRPNGPVRLVAAGDTNRDGRADFCMWHPNWAFGAGLWAIEGTSRMGTFGVGRAQIVSAGGDYDGDGVADIVEAWGPVGQPDTVVVHNGLLPAVIQTIQWPQVTGRCVAVAGPAPVVPGSTGAIASTWHSAQQEVVLVHVGGDAVAVGRGSGSGFTAPELRSDRLVTGATAVIHGSRSAPGVAALGLSLGRANPTTFFGADLWIDQATTVWSNLFTLRPTFTQWGEGFATTPEDRHLMGDVDGDGHDDVVIWRGADGRWEARLSNGHGLATTWVLGNHGVAGDRVFLADINGDGRDDAITVTTATGVWNVAYAQSAGFAAPAFWAYWWVTTAPDWLVGDVDGDGRDDLVVWGASNNGVPGWYVARSTPTGPTYGAWWGSSGGSATSRFLADVNNDGRADAVEFYAANGQWVVALSTGTSFATPRVWISSHGNGLTRQVLADVDGGGADAIVIAGGNWSVARATPLASAFAPPTGWLTNVGGAATAQLCGDLHGDGAADAVFFYENSGNGFVMAAPSLAPSGLPAFMAPGFTGFGLPVTVPAMPSLVGVTLTMQEFMVPSLRPMADVTNGVVATIR